MKRKTKFRIFSLVLATVALSSACGQEVVDFNDNTKTQVQISAYESGFGTEWLENYADTFEEKYKDVSFEEGKVGVKISVNWNQDSYSTVLSKVASSDNAIYLNNVNYYDVATSGVALDLTDYIKQPLTEYNDSQAIIDKLDSQQKDFYTSYDGRYYGIPSFETYEGVHYDIDLFENAQYGGFYLAEGGGYTTGVNGAKPKSKGPDGVSDTYDDGMPVTMDEFFALLDHMVSKNVTPFIWSGLYKYADMLTKQLWINNVGNEIKLNFTFNGTATDLIDVNGNSINRLGDVEITPANGYMLQKSEALYRALEFARKLVDNSSYYHVESFSKSLTHVGAQERYLYSMFDSKSKPIAFLIEGSYWQCEARGIFNSINESYSQDDEYSFENRRYGMMTIPFYSNDVAAKNYNKQTTLANSQTLFVKKNLNDGVKNAAISFVKFLYSRDMLKQFLVDNHYSMGVKLELSEEEKAELPAFALASYEKKANSNVIYPYSTSKFWLSYSGSTFKWGENGYSLNATSLGADYTDPIYNFYKNKNLTAEAYFNGICATMQKKWASLNTSLA